MDLNQIPIMGALKDRMRWLMENQRVIAENVANADTPGYEAKALARQDFSGLVENFAEGDGVSAGGAVSASTVGPVTMLATEPGHMGPNGNPVGASGTEKVKSVEHEPTGNSVVLEEEMMRMAENQMKYGLAANLYRKNIELLKKAIGRGQ